MSQTRVAEAVKGSSLRTSSVVMIASVIGMSVETVGGGAVIVVGCVAMVMAAVVVLHPCNTTPNSVPLKLRTSALHHSFLLIG
jgi:hypothetical protein